MGRGAGSADEQGRLVCLIPEGSKGRVAAPRSRVHGQVKGRRANHRDDRDPLPALATPGRVVELWTRGWTQHRSFHVTKK